MSLGYVCTQFPRWLGSGSGSGLAAEALWWVGQWGCCGVVFKLASLALSLGSFLKMLQNLFFLLKLKETAANKSLFWCVSTGTI